jgi:hypothetical protein
MKNVETRALQSQVLHSDASGEFVEGEAKI